MTTETSTSLLAYHWYEADEPEMAIEYAAKAALNASRLSSPEAEVVQWRRVLDMWPRVPCPEKVIGRSRGEVVLSVVRAGRALDQPALVSELFADERLRLDAVADPLGGLWLRVRLSLRRDGYRDRDRDQDAAWTERLLNWAEPDPRTIDALAMLADRGLIPKSQGPAVRDKMLSIAQELRDPRQLVWAHIGISHLMLRSGEFEQAVELIRSVQPQIMDAPLSDQWSLQVHLLWYLILLGRADEAIIAARRELSRIERPEVLPAPYMSICENLSHALEATGHWDEAVDVATAARTSDAPLTPDPNRSPHARWELLLAIRAGSVPIDAASTPRSQLPSRAGRQAMIRGKSQPQPRVAGNPRP